MRLVLFLAVFSVACYAHTAAEWKSRTIYQLLTDRFSTTSGSYNPCGNIGNYCGGTFQGIIKNLDYIAGMGFDAIWISPVVKNSDGGYHGYWAQDFFQTNPNFGSISDLAQLVQECHNRGIWVMVDVVANHVGYTNPASPQINPFNQGYHYHDCNGCPSSCNIENWSNAWEVEHCRLAGLPDLNQDNAWVRSQLISWVTNLVSNYSFDAIRIDTVPEVKGDFWKSFTSNAGVFSIGEVFNGDANYVAPFQNYMDSVLSYPLYYTIRDVFQNRKSMTEITSMRSLYAQKFRDTSVLGTFVDNHDNARFLNSQSDLALYQNALTYVLMSTGIPIVYYGTEQAFHGGNDPQNREVLWTSQYDTNSTLYTFLANVINTRKTFHVWEFPQVEQLSADTMYAFTRGDVLVALTNLGTRAVLSTSVPVPYTDGSVLCSIFDDRDCPMVDNGHVSVSFDGGRPNIYVPQSSVSHRKSMKTMF